VTTPNRTFTLERRRIGTATVFYLDGPLRLGHREAPTGRQLSDAVREVVLAGEQRVAIDLSGLVRTPDSSGLGELVAAESALRQRGGILVLVNVPPKVRAVIGNLGLDRLFQFAENEDEAITLLGDA